MAFTSGNPSAVTSSRKPYVATENFVLGYTAALKKDPPPSPAEIGAMFGYSVKELATRVKGFNKMLMAEYIKGGIPGTSRKYLPVPVVPGSTGKRGRKKADLGALIGMLANLDPTE